MTQTNIKQADNKAIEYAYPTSDTAKKFGFYDKGCYFVALYNGMERLYISAAYETIQEARAFANGLRYPLNRYSL